MQMFQMMLIKSQMAPLTFSQEMQCSWFAKFIWKNTTVYLSVNIELKLKLQAILFSKKCLISHWCVFIYK